MPLVAQPTQAVAWPPTYEPIPTPTSAPKPYAGIALKKGYDVDKNGNLYSGG